MSAFRTAAYASVGHSRLDVRRIRHPSGNCARRTVEASPRGTLFTWGLDERREGATDDLHLRDRAQHEALCKRYVDGAPAVDQSGLTDRGAGGLGFGTERMPNMEMRLVEQTPTWSAGERSRLVTLRVLTRDLVDSLERAVRAARLQARRRSRRALNDDHLSVKARRWSGSRRPRSTTRYSGGSRDATRPSASRRGGGAYRWPRTARPQRAALCGGVDDSPQ